MRRCPLRKCPLCEAELVDGSGGWANQYVCGTRCGNLSETVIFLGKDCDQELGKGLPNERQAFEAHWLGGDLPTITVAEALKRRHAKRLVNT